MKPITFINRQAELFELARSETIEKDVYLVYGQGLGNGGLLTAEAYELYKASLKGYHSACLVEACLVQDLADEFDLYSKTDISDLIWNVLKNDRSNK